MNTFELLQINLLSPVVLCFALGAIAALLKSDLELPDAFVTALSIYLLLAIGLKGGVELRNASLSQLILPIIVTIALGCAIPAWSYAVLRWLGKFEVADAAALAAHFGSCSVVTFIAATTFLVEANAPAEGFLPALVAIMEVPAIVVALIIARSKMQTSGSWGTVVHEVFAGRSVLLLLGGLAIGYAAGSSGFAPVKLLFVDAFRGILCLFLLELGIKAASRFGDLRKVGPFLFAFSIIMPLLHGVLGVWLGQLCGLSVGGATALGTLAASASYIAAPAAVKIALPEANPAYYLTASLAIAFPFNLAIGIPIYFRIAEALYNVV
jgi:hypothetical protein